MFKRIRLLLDEARINRILSSATTSRFARRLAKYLVISQVHHSFVLSGDSPPRKTKSFDLAKHTMLLAHNRYCLAESYFFALYMICVFLSWQHALSLQFRSNFMSDLTSCMISLLVHYHRLPADFVNRFFQDRLTYYELAHNSSHGGSELVSNGYRYFYRALKAEFDSNVFLDSDEICASCPNIDDLFHLFPPLTDPTPLAIEASAYQDYVIDTFSAAVRRWRRWHS